MPLLGNVPGSDPSPPAARTAQVQFASSAVTQQNNPCHHRPAPAERLQPAVLAQAIAAGTSTYTPEPCSDDVRTLEMFGPHNQHIGWPVPQVPLRSHGSPSAVPDSPANDRDNHLMLSQTAGLVAHDINNILGCILISVQRLLQSEPCGASRQKQHGQDVIASVERAAVLARRLLDMTRHVPGIAGRTNTADVVTGMAGLFRRVLGPSIQITATAKPGIPWASCERELLENALLNLALNARKAMPQGGHIAISADHAEQPADGSGTILKPAKSYVRISMTDSGCGMAPDVLARAFDPFFTTGSAHGMGLGLASVLDFVRDAGGTVQAFSTLGVGTTVTLLLPAIAPEEVSSNPCEPPVFRPVDARGNPVTILIVEDEPDLRALMAETLSDQGIHTVLACDAEAALTVLNSTQALDLMITDLGLPDQDGRILAQTARQQRSGLPVLFVTGSAPAELHDPTGNAFERTYVLAKPFRSQALRHAIDRLLAKVSTPIG